MLLSRRIDAYGSTIVFDSLLYVDCPRLILCSKLECATFLRKTAARRIYDYGGAKYHQLPKKEKFLAPVKGCDEECISQRSIRFIQHPLSMH